MSEHCVPFSPGEGYSLVADVYDAWHWRAFWRRNETPRVEDIVRDATPTLNVRLLDVGCGTAELTAKLLGQGYDAHGVDVSSRMVDVARTRLGKDRVWVASAQSLPFKDASFEVVLACRVFSHVRRLAKALRELRRVARDGALLVVTDIHSSHRYKHTRVSGEWGEVSIHTVKRSPEKVKAIAGALGWKLVAEETVTARNASWLPVEDPRFHSIDSTGTHPVGYILVFKNNGRRTVVSGRVAVAVMNA